MAPIFWTQKQDIGPAARARHGMAYDAARQRVVVFGGDHGGPPFADTWQWDGSLWTQVGDMGPSARHSLALADDAARQRVVLFGGAAGGISLDDTWTWDGTAWTQVADTGPSPRSGHATAFDATHQTVVLFGGVAAGNLGDTWQWDGTEWTQVQDVGPSPRQGHAMAFDAVSGKVLLFGGAGDDGTGLGDTWAWDGGAWAQVADTGPDPRAAAGMAGAAEVILFGGVNSIDPTLAASSRITYGDSWRWVDGSWTRVQDIGPAARWGHGLAFRTDASRMTLFGGSTLFAAAEDTALAPGLAGDTWEVPEAAAQPGGGQPGTPAGSAGVDVAAVSVSPDTTATPGDVLDVSVTLTAPSAQPVNLVAAIFMNSGGGYQQLDPPGFQIPIPLVVPAGVTTWAFQIVREAQPLVPGDYAIGVGVEGGTTMQGGFFTVV